ncbi:MerR family transcriptional regulator [Kribbella sandramycini]|uniref:DNA-binding transcriptional MerR regulator n=1 Tax=Kribbella sandramycini TaxID=60450 RepID=A0A7Y4L1S9_9ACTN|nr:MerR family transcriptional regulator [Kribbella sandramycini]MBB6566570.1 DNA-binding transcriptional MerR regulator [Kribbella sandramycini]NOL42774.1 MerR family transcriptional regulator [Kribbella sandramycini]
MRIGALAERTGTSRRLLRYYEEQGLIGSRRSDNGYRDYADSCVDKVIQIRGLLDAGLPTRVIREVLPCLDTPRAIQISAATSETIELLEAEHARMSERIRFLERNRTAISAYLTAIREAQAEAGPQTLNSAEAAVSA